MKDYKSLAFALLASLPLMTACKSYDFEQEQYRKEVNLLQNSDGVFDTQSIKMHSDKEPVLYVVVGLSGSQKSTQDYAVTLVKDDSLLNGYNKSRHDLQTQRYAKMLPEECYDEPALNAVIKAGDSQVRLPVMLKNLERLSPDVEYFLNYRFDPNMSTPVNHKKKHVLLRIHWENEFASTKTAMHYNYTSSQVINSQTSQVYRPTHTIQAYPLSANSVRLLAGNEDGGDPKKDPTAIRQKSVIVTFGKQLETNPLAREVVITPHDESQLEVEMMNPIGEYDNTILLNELVAIGGGVSIFYKEFRLHYKYRLKTATGANGAFKEVKAKLRYSYNPRADKL